MEKTERAEHLAALLHDALEARFDAIVGVERLSVSCGLGSSTRDAYFQIAFNGWSPTLHPLAIKQAVHTAQRDAANAKLSDREIVQDAAADSAISNLLATQRRRATAAAAILPPLTVPFAYSRIDHLHTDIAMIPILRGLNRDPESVLANALRTSHGGTANTDVSNRYDSFDVTMFERTADDGKVQHVLLPHITFGTGAEPWMANWKDDKIVLWCEIPATRRATIVGQPLGSLISIHPVLDHRIIRKMLIPNPDRHFIELYFDLELDTVANQLALHHKALIG